MYVVGVDVTMPDHYKNIRKLQEIIHQEVLGNNFNLKTLKEINSKMEILIESLNYWAFYDNMNRYYYDLKSFLDWLKQKNKKS